MKPILAHLSAALRRSLWMFYVVIVLEILYMISPFALYYYSLYKVPLAFLQARPATAFLTLTILPHFAHQTSPLIHFLQLVSWPLILLGLALFLVAFVQIYRAKLRRGGAVAGGLYRVVRHPQYAALAVLGLGCSIYWSRFIVCLTYAVMLFLYYFLARQEERLCLEKFGDAYRKYLETTGMFLPRAVARRLPRLPVRLPAGGWRRLAAIVSLFVLYMAVVTGGCFALRRHALSGLVTLTEGQRLLLAVADIPRGDMAAAGRLAAADPRVREMRQKAGLGRELIYILPAGWGIPELGVAPHIDGNAFLGNPGGHGNAAVFAPHALVVLICRPILSKPCSVADTLFHAVGFIPYLEVGVDLRAGRVLSCRRRTDRGQWDGIPVPLY